MHRKEAKLLTAAKSNRFEELRKVLDKIDKAKTKRKLKGTIDIDAKDSTGSTALHYAAKHGNIEMMVYLVSRDACIESIDQIGWRPISYACANNNINAVKTLIECKSNVNKFSLMEENSPLHIAAGFGYVDIVKLLMDSGANVHYQNKKRQTPMDIACENNHYGVVNALLLASSKLIEDATASNPAVNNFTDSLSSSLSKSSLFIKSQSINNANHILSRVKPGAQINGECEAKRRTIGSQSQLCIPMELPQPRKSGSLNTIFINDQSLDDEKSAAKIMDDKTNNSEIEVNMPYPSKFSTSEKLKIKSPLLSTKNLRWIDKIRRNNPSVIEISPDQCSAQFIYPEVSPKSPNFNRNSKDRFSTDLNSLSKSNNLDKEYLSIQTSMYCITSPHKVTSFKPQTSISSNNSSDFESPNQKSFPKSLSHKGKFDSIRRGFGSENDIILSPAGKVKGLSKRNSKKPTTDVRSPSLIEFVPQQTTKKILMENNSGNSEKYTCYNWIKSLGLERIWDTLFKEGFESFLALTLASTEELLLLCDDKIDDWDNLQRNLELLNIPAINQLKLSTKISDLLFQLGLDCYTNNFHNNGISHTQQTIGFNDSHLNKLQIIKIGHRKLILKCFSVVNNEEKCDSETSPSLSFINELLPSMQEESKYFHEKNDMVLQQKELSTETFTKSVNLLRNSDSIYQMVMSRKLPPPIPYRSSSIYELENPKDLTLDDILSPPNIEPVADKNNKDTHVDNSMPNESSLDDIVDLLQSLGKELDLELNNI